MLDVIDWQQASSVTFDHEFEHLIQREKFGFDPGLFEFFASSAEYLGNPVYPPGTGEITDDVCYDNTVATNSSVPVPNYPIWRSWGAYLHQHFRSTQGIGNDLLRVWNRTSTRDLRSLPAVLEYSNYDKLGCLNCATGYKGQFRIEQLNNKIGVARWVDEPSFPFSGWTPPTGQGPWGYFLNFDPGYDLGLFRKISSGSLHCDYSHTVPPVYQLGIGNLNTLTAVSCYIDPRDPRPCPPSTPENLGCAPRTVTNRFCYRVSPYCMESEGCGDPIDLYPWAADVVGFVGGAQFSDGNYYELETTFNFNAVPSTDCDTRETHVAPCSYRYFVNVVTYETNDTVTDLWDRGQYMTSINTYGPYFATAPRELQFVIGDFGCPLIRSVAFVVTLADSVGMAMNTAWSDHVRLDYSYSYRVRNPNPGPGYTCPLANTHCPFVYVAGPGGVLLDNNILGEGAWHADDVPENADVSDEYVLSRPVEARDGLVHLEIREEAREETLLDATRLITLDVPEGMTLARMLPSSRVGLVSGLAAVGRIVDNQGRDVTETLEDLDGDVIERTSTEYVEFDFVKSASVGIEIIVLDPLLKQPPPGGWNPPESFTGDDGRAGIMLQAEADGEFHDLIEFVPRDRGEKQCVATSVIPGQPGDTVRIRLRFDAQHGLDWIGVGHWTEVEGTTLELVGALHSSRGDVASSLRAIDESYETLGPGEKIELTFGRYEPAPGRELCLATRGHYVIPRGFVENVQGQGPLIRVRDRSASATGVVRLAAFPNPTRGATTLEIELPARELVEAAIYSTDGHLVRNIHGGSLEAGTSRLTWDGRNEVGLAVPSGQYYYQIRGGDWERSGKLFVIK